MNPALETDLKWTRKDLLTLEALSEEEIRLVIQTARSFKEVSLRSIKKVPALRGKVVVLWFAEPSTRTTNSFSLAAQRLSADIINIVESASSSKKGETLVDAAKNIEAMGVDIVVLRHQAAGAPMELARHLGASVVNAGDGTHEHPTQGLLDLFTIMEHRGDNLKGLKVALVGDISHSRVARSNIWALKKLGADVTVVGPPTLVPKNITRLGVKISYDLDEGIGQYDVINLLRIQLERQAKAMFPSIREYSRLYGIDAARLARAKKDVLVMHPGPMNRGVEISGLVADGPNSVILQQVSNGVAVRMAVLYLVNGAHKTEAAHE